LYILIQPHRKLLLTNIVIISGRDAFKGLEPLQGCVWAFFRTKYWI